MPRQVGGSEGRARISSLLRTAGLVAGILLGAGGVWVLVTSDSTKDTRIGALLGIWGIFLAATVLIGRREHDVVEASGQLVVRGATGLDTLGDARAVREYEQRLQAMLRHEIQQTLGAELASLRADVAALRDEVVEKVGGELRLERIETTRVIGSDIEALQREVRQLRSARFDDDGFDAPRPTPRPTVTVEAEIVETAPPPPRPAPPAPFVPPAPPAPPAPPVAPVQRREPIPQVELTAPVPLLRDLSSPPERPQPSGAPEPLVPGMPDPIAAPEPSVAPEAFVTGSYWQTEADRHSAPLPWTLGAPEAGSLPQAEPEPAPEPAPERVPEPEPEPEPAASEIDANDPFASLPRIRPFTEFDLDPIEAPATPVNYGPAARHASDAQEPGRSGGGRRRRDDGDDDDVLARILQRERGN